MIDIFQDYAVRILTNGMYVSALNGLLVFIVGMIIVHFTPERRPPEAKAK